MAPKVDHLNTVVSANMKGITIVKEGRDIQGLCLPVSLSELSLSELDPELELELELLESLLLLLLLALRRDDLGPNCCESAIKQTKKSNTKH